MRRRATITIRIADGGILEPMGTNLLDATQAEAMVRHMLEGLPAARPASGERETGKTDEWDAHERDRVIVQTSPGKFEWQDRYPAPSPPSQASEIVEKAIERLRSASAFLVQCQTRDELEDQRCDVAAFGVNEAMRLIRQQAGEIESLTKYNVSIATQSETWVKTARNAMHDLVATQARAEAAEREIERLTRERDELKAQTYRRTK